MLGTRLVCLLMPAIGGGRGRQGLSHSGWVSFFHTSVNLLLFLPRSVVIPTSAMAALLESLVVLGSADWKDV